jgi:phospholipid-binding lipoprotein MlaA
MRPSASSTVRLAGAALSAALLAGCATTGEPDPRDPLEGLNRGVYQFNDAVDRYALKPVAQAYDFVMPDFAQNCIHNIFSNVGDLWAGLNSLLQGRPVDFINTLGRVLFNTTLGLGGCIDVATMNGANKIPNDFGTTLGVWGLGQGPYLVLPFLGSSTMRDGTGLAVDTLVNPVAVGEIDNVRLRNSLGGVQAVATRASLLNATDTVDRVSLDPYSFVRDAYLQRRAALLRSKTGEGEAPPPNYDDEE